LSKHIPQLDSVRAIAILVVFIHHALKIKLMWTGVDLFFILSGFLITGVLLDARQNSLGDYFARFYARRALRILPPYLLALAMVGLFWGWKWLQYWYFYILLTNFLLPLHIPHPTAFDPLWSLAVEEQFYIFWPFAVYFLSVRSLRNLSLLLIVAAPLLRAVCLFGEHWPIYTLTPFRMDLLASGALLNLTWRSHPGWVEKYGPRLGFLLMALGLLGFAALGGLEITTYGNTRIGNALVYEASLLLCLGFMLYALSGWRVNWMRWEPLRFVGRISYSMYLFHLGILLLLNPWFEGFSLVLVGLLLTMLCASLSWFLMERKLLQAGRPA